jgi:hypothetical protein
MCTKLPDKAIFLLLSGLLLFGSRNWLAAQPDEKEEISADSLKINKSYKPEIFTSGFIDIMNNGQINASARFLRMYIGEPGGFAIPLSLYAGVSANSFQNKNSPGDPESNEHLVMAYINPLSGLVNMSVDGIVYFKRTDKLTRTGLLYQVGERILTGYKEGSVANPAARDPVNFLNSFGNAGFYFQTGAWERNNEKNVGIFWLALRYLACYTNPRQLGEFLPDLKTKGIYTGYSFAFGVEINNLINLKVVYYRYIKKPEIAFPIPIYQFSFNYSLKEKSD